VGAIEAESRRHEPFAMSTSQFLRVATTSHRSWPMSTCLPYPGCSTRRYAAAAALVLMPRVGIGAVFDTIADRRWTTNTLVGDPIAAPFPGHPSLPPDRAARDADRCGASAGSVEFT
jgi:hypothetical protein